MNIRIYQVNMSRDVNNVGFASYENLEKWQGTSAIDSSIYDKVFSGEVKCKTLEDLKNYILEHYNEIQDYDGLCYSNHELFDELLESIDDNLKKAA